MKRYSALVGLLLLAATACDNNNPTDNPRITEVIFSAESYQPGEEIVMSIAAKGSDVPLSTVNVKAILDGIYLVDESDVRTPGTASVAEYRVKVPLLAQMDDTRMQFLLELESVNGTKSSSEASVNIRKPSFPRLYLILSDGSLAVMEPTEEDPSRFCTEVELPRNAVVRVTNRIDQSGFNWYWSVTDNAVKLGEDTTPIPVQNVSAGLHTVTFDVYSFGLEAQLSI